MVDDPTIARTAVIFEYISLNCGRWLFFAVVEFQEILSYSRGSSNTLSYTLFSPLSVRARLIWRLAVFLQICSIVSDPPIHFLLHNGGCKAITGGTSVWSIGYNHLPFQSTSRNDRGVWGMELWRREATNTREC